MSAPTAEEAQVRHGGGVGTRRVRRGGSWSVTRPTCLRGTESTLRGTESTSGCSAAVVQVVVRTREGPSLRARLGARYNSRGSLPPRGPTATLPPYPRHRWPQSQTTLEPLTIGGNSPPMASHFDNPTQRKASARRYATRSCVASLVYTTFRRRLRSRHGHGSS
jgi:hypothetical protein